MFVRILEVPRWFLFPAVTALSFVAVYAVNQSAFDLFLMTIFGVLGYGLRKIEVPLAPIILGLVLGPLMERNVRRALLLSDGEWSVLFSSPIAVTFLALTFASLTAPALLWLLRRRRQGA